MIETKNFKTRSEIVDRDLPKIRGNNQYKGKTIVALDGGYSAVKGVGPNRLFIFPSYAKKTPKELDILSKVKATDIQYRNNVTGDVWLVGGVAEALMDSADVNSTTDEYLFTRYRYNSDIFKVIMSTGLALGLLGTGNGNEIFLQTGLPAKYKSSDEKKIVNALKGDYDISIKVGSGDWATFQFSLDEDHIGVMEQPQGTLCAAAYDNGEISKIGKTVLTSNTVILDVGFETEDIISIIRGYKTTPETYPDTGMRAVFDEVIKRIEAKNADAQYKVFEFQKYLEEGKAPFFDNESFKMEYIAFSDILEQVNTEMCEKSVRRLMQLYDNLKDYKYLIVTGGTGESRFAQIKDMLSGLPHLTVLPGNVNTPDLSFTYSNVIGYYMFRYANLKKSIAQSA